MESLADGANYRLVIEGLRPTPLSSIYQRSPDLFDAEAGGQAQQVGRTDRSRQSELPNPGIGTLVPTTRMSRLTQSHSACSGSTTKHATVVGAASVR